MSEHPLLNRKLELEERQPVPDGSGGFTENWGPVGTLWAALEARRGNERLIGNRVVSGVTYRILVRGAPYGSPRRPRPDQRFVDGPRVYSILAVAENDPGGQYLECWAEEGSKQ